MERNLALEFVRVTEEAAIASARWMGRGDGKAADQAAVDAMREAFNYVNIDGVVVIGEGERDEAPMLYIGERVGSGNGIKVDIALDPLECTNSVAHGRSNALAVIAAAEDGCFLHAPDTYMEKIAVGKEAVGSIDINTTTADNLKSVAKAKECDVTDLTVVILDRERHQQLIAEVRQAGARIRLIPDGDVSAAIATAIPDSGVDLLMGVGGAPEGVLAAAALKCVGGDFQGRLAFRNEHEKERAFDMGMKDPKAIFSIDELARGESVVFAATGVTDGEMLKGVRYFGNGALTHSLVMRSKSGTVRLIETTHNFNNE